MGIEAYLYKPLSKNELSHVIHEEPEKAD